MRPGNIAPKHYPNLAAAQKLAAEVFNKLCAAQKANEFDLSGHAQRAKEMQDRVCFSLRLAMEANAQPDGDNWSSMK